METKAIADRLVELCREGKFEQAQTELFSADAVSIEPESMQQGAMGNAHGLPAIIEKGRQFMASVETVHSMTVSAPAVAGNWFSVAMTLDVTFKGRGRTMMEEICAYRVQEGKITSERFLYG
jgi:hypothetical protein